MRLKNEPDQTTKFIGVEVPIALHKKMKIEAAMTGRTMQQLLSEAVELVYGGRGELETGEKRNQ